MIALTFWAAVGVLLVAAIAAVEWILDLWPHHDEVVVVDDDDGREHWLAGPYDRELEA